jgi:hypothetical protein
VARHLAVAATVRALTATIRTPLWRTRGVRLAASPRRQCAGASIKSCANSAEDLDTRPMSILYPTP